MKNLEIKKTPSKKKNISIKLNNKPFQNSSDLILELMTKPRGVFQELYLNTEETEMILLSLLYLTQNYIINTKVDKLKIIIDTEDIKTILSLIELLFRKNIINGVKIEKYSKRKNN